MVLAALILTEMLFSLSASVHAFDLKPWGPDGGPTTMTYDDGVKAYRDGDYDQAAKIFKTLHKAQPEQVGITYYLAMTSAQQRNYGEARRLYQEVITLDPQGEAGQLSKEGLANLPALSATGLDKPPKFEHTEAKTPMPQPAAQAYGQTYGSGVPAATAQAQMQAQMPEGMTGQDIMMLQQVFGGGNQQSNNNSNNWMQMMMQPQNPNDPNSMQPQFNPDMMSTMMMNQMMQNFSLDAGKKDE